MVAPRYNPPFDISDVSDYISYPAGNPTGVYVLGYDGSLFCFGVNVIRGANGEAYFAGKHAARLDFATPTEAAANKRIAIIATDGSRYALPA